MTATLGLAKQIGSFLHRRPYLLLAALALPAAACPQSQQPIPIGQRPTKRSTVEGRFLFSKATTKAILDEAGVSLGVLRASATQDQRYAIWRAAAKKVAKMYGRGLSQRAQTILEDELFARTKEAGTITKEGHDTGSSSPDAVLAYPLTPKQVVDIAQGLRAPASPPPPTPVATPAAAPCTPVAIPMLTLPALWEVRLGKTLPVSLTFSSQTAPSGLKLKVREKVITDPVTASPSKGRDKIYSGRGIISAEGLTAETTYDVMLVNSSGEIIAYLPQQLLVHASQGGSDADVDVDVDSDSDIDRDTDADATKAQGFCVTHPNDPTCGL